MTSTLHERLHRLADQVDPTTDPTAGQELWRRGRRYQRVRRSGSVLVAGVAAVAALLVGTVAWQRSAPPPRPVPADAPVGLPSRIHTPSPWLPGTAEAGPLGRLAALFRAERGGWWGTSEGVVGVSATTGEYRFLDLPDGVVGSFGLAPVPAPDGRLVAYWLAGRPDGTPNTGWHHDTVVGVAVYDAATGEVERQFVETEHGLSAERLAWVDEDTLSVHAGQLMAGDDGGDMERSQSAHAPVLRWDLGAPELRVWRTLEGVQPHVLGPTAGGRAVAVTGENRLHVLGAALPGARPERMPYGGGLGGMDGAIAIDPTGNRVASVWGGNNKNPNKVVVATLPLRAGEVLRYELLPRSGRTFDVEGWIDEGHVAVTRRAEPLDEGMGMAVFAVDVETGAASELVTLPEGRFNGVAWATDLLDAPVVDRPAPPSPLDPRVTAGLLVAIGLGAGLGVWGWRRRVRP